MKIFTTDDKFVTVMTTDEGKQLCSKAEILNALQAEFTKVALEFRKDFLDEFQQAKDDGDSIRMECVRQMALLSGDAYKRTCLAAYAALDSLQSDRQTVTE